MKPRDRKPPRPDATIEAALSLSGLEFRYRLLRRLDLLQREIDALDSSESHQAFLEATESLRVMREGIEERLAATPDPESGLESRVVVVEMWRSYRREFERLAAAWHRSYPARPGQRDRGPRW